MNTAEKIIKQFKTIDEKDALLIRQESKDIYRYTHNLADGALMIDFIKKDTLSVQLMQVNLSHNRIGALAGDTENWKQLGNRLCEDISYLSENLKIIEIDRTHRQMQIRSYPPYVKDNLRIYFEILVDFEKSTMNLVRKQSNLHDRTTSKVSFVIGDEVLTRLFNTILKLIDD